MLILRTTALALALTTVSVPALFIAATPAAANVQQITDSVYVASARTHYEAGRLREASIELKNALREDPNNGPARYLLGRILFDQGDLAGADKEMTRAHELAPSDDTAIRLAETKLQRADYEAALALVTGDGQSVDATVRRLTVRGAALSALKRYDEAEASYLRSLEIDSRRVEGHFGLAQVYTARKDYRAAANKLDEIVIGKPDFSPGWMLRGEVALAKGDKQAAFVAFDRAVTLAPDTAPPLIARARAHLAAGELDRAKADMTAVQAMAPNAPITHYLKAAVAFAEGDLDGANQSFTQLQRNFENFAPAVLLGALIKNQRGEHNQADLLLSRYIGMQPDSIEARRALATVRLENGQPRNAIDMLKDVLRESPNDATSLRQLASAYLSLDEFDQAEGVFRKLEAVGSPRAARDARMALKLLNPPSDAADPIFSDVTVRHTLLKAVDRSTNGDPEGAESLLNNLDSRIPESATVLSLRGSIVAQLGDTKRARALLTRALELEPELTSAIGTFEQIDLREGKSTAILPRLKGLLDNRPQSELLTLGIAQRMGMEGNRAGATTFLSERTRVAPNSIAISRALISALMVQEQFGQAGDEAIRISTIAKQDPAAMLFATNALIDAGDPARAVKVATRLRDIAGNSPRAHTLLSEAQSLSGDISGARATLKAARKKWSDDVGVASALVKLEVEQKNPAGVKEATDTLARRNPSAAARLSANALAQMGQPALAVKALEQAFAKNPDQRLAVDLFTQRRRAGQDDAAFHALSGWVEKNPGDRAALMTLATGFLEVGRQGESSKAYEALLTMEPNNPVALNNYAWLRHQNQRPDALDYAQRAYDAASGSPEIADTYGWMLVTYGKLKEGLDLLKTAKDAAPNNPDIHYHFAYALSKAGRRDEAKSVLVDLLGNGGNFEERAEAEQLMQELGG